MTRMMIIAGVHLDRAWTDLGPVVGSALRDWSRQVLALAVDEAVRRDVQALVVLGDLTDRAAALPDTVDFAAQVLGSFPGQVLVVPGCADWTDGNDLYALMEWAPNTTVLNSGSFAPVMDRSDVLASGWTSPVASNLRVAQDHSETELTVLRPALTEDEAIRLQAHGQVITSGTAAEGSLSVPDLVRAPGTDGGWGFIVDLEDGGEAERVQLPPQPGAAATLDVSSSNGQSEFAEALTQAAQQDGPVVVSLIGLLAPSVLLPGFGGPQLPPNVVLDLTSLRYAAETPEPTDRSTRAEFLRAMATTRGDERERHQTTALGLRALESAAGAGTAT